MITNDHVFTALNSPDEKHYVIDPLQPKFNGYIDLGHRHSRQDSQFGIINAQTFADSYIAKSHSKLQISNLAKKYFWLMPGNFSVAYTSQDVVIKRKVPKNQNIIYCSYEPELGRRVVRQYSELLAAKYNQDHELILEKIIELGPYFPDLDARNDKKYIKKAFASCLNIRADDLILSALEHIDASLGCIEEPRLLELRAELHKKVGAYLMDARLLSKGVELYDHASEITQHLSSEPPTLLPK